MHEWLTVIIVLLIVGVLLDGVRRMRQARRNSLRMNLDIQKDVNDEDLQAYGSELPNGGARIANRQTEEQSSKEQSPEAQPPEGVDKAAQIAGEIHHDNNPESDYDNSDESIPESHTDSNENPIEGTENLYHALNQTSEYEPSPSKPFPTEQHTLDLEENVPMLMDSVKIKAGDRGKDRSEPTLGADSESHAVKSPGKRIEPKLKPLSKKSSKMLSLSQSEEQPEEVLIVHVKAAEEAHFQGKELLKLILDQGLRFGEMNIFHRHINKDGEGPILFSLVNMVAPGAFDLAKFDDLLTPGVSLFLRLPMTDGDSMVTFDIMLTTAKTIANALGGEVHDDQHSVMTKQTIEHYRERIRNFSLKQQLLERA